MGDIDRGDMSEKKAARVVSAMQQALEAAEAAIKHEEGLIAGNTGRKSPSGVIGIDITPA